MTPAPAWLAALQSSFGELLRSSLDRSTGTLTARTAEYDPALLAAVDEGPHAPAAERLAVYHRQYWFRLFTALQTAHPLTTRLLGPWRFNDHADRFLRAHGPSHWDIDRDLDGFDRSLAATLTHGPDRAIVLEAVALDTLRRSLFRAPAVRPFAPGPADAARLPDGRLVPSPAVAVFRETFALVEGLDATDPTAVPPPLAHPRWWLLTREPAAIRYTALAPLEGELLTRLAGRTVRAALAELEALCDASARSSLPAEVQRWLAQSVARGCWVGLDDDARH